MPSRDGDFLQWLELAPPRAASGSADIRSWSLQEGLQEHLCCARNEQREAKDDKERQRVEQLKQTEAKRQKIIREWKKLCGFLEEQLPAVLAGRARQSNCQERG